MAMRLFRLLIFCVIPVLGAVQQFDVVVYGGTAGGVIAAVSAAREGLRTALVEPRGQIGGMVSGGLGFTDFGRKEVIGGYALEFFRLAGKHYGMERYGNPVAWYFEPHVAEAILRQMLKDAKVTLFENQRLREQGGVQKTGTTVDRILTEDGSIFSAAIFIDSSYEGDLMAQAGVTWTYGREAESQYGESLAGVRGTTPLHQFLVNIVPKGPDGRLLPEVYSGKPGPPGSADKKVQAYNYRMCFSDEPGNMVAFAKPPKYDRSRYQLLAKLIESRTAAEGRVPPLKTFLKLDRIPNGKLDVNNQGAFSTDYIGGSWNYPTASYAERAVIWREHEEYTAGLFYFLANDQQVPAELRKEMNGFGLAKDEFTANHNWPNQLYIRESRRMVGEYVMTQKDLQTDLTKPDRIGMGSYNSDSHNIERIVDDAGFVRNEGDMQVPVKPYQIPFRVMLPKGNEAGNLLVPVAFSASHVAYSSIRMEPQYMILGQAAGVAAKLAIASGKPVQLIDVTSLIGRLKAQGAVLELPAVSPQY